MMIYTEYQNTDTMIAAQCSVGTVKGLRCDMDRCNRDYEAVASRKGCRRHSNCMYAVILLCLSKQRHVQILESKRKSNSLHFYKQRDICKQN